MKAFELETRLIEFASRVMDMAEGLPETYSARHIASQMHSLGYLTGTKLW